MKTRMRPSSTLVALAFLAAVLAAISLSDWGVRAAPPLSGAIFTTNVSGTRVNQNHFPDKCAVYLDGGPGPNAPQGAAGLPDGDYYFQVTDPSGKTLLSTDPVANRQIHVSGGIITGNSGLGNHVTGVDIDYGGATIQLCPFLDTPNPGGVYKVWVTPVADFVGNPSAVDSPCGHGCFHGFIPAASKTDNFKVKPSPQPCLEVVKFCDLNKNGAFDNGEPLIPNWPFNVFGSMGNQINGTLFTSYEGGCQIFNLEAGSYRVVEDLFLPSEPDLSWMVTTNILDGKVLTNPDTEVLVRIRSNDRTRTVVFGNKVVPRTP